MSFIKRGFLINIKKAAREIKFIDLASLLISLPNKTNSIIMAARTTGTGKPVIQI